MIKNLTWFVPQLFLPEGINIKKNGIVEIEPNKVIEDIIGVDLGIKITSINLKSKIIEIKIKVKND